MGKLGQLTSAEKAKDKRLRVTFNTTLEAQNAVRAEQHNDCGICDRSFVTFTAFQDHDHECCPRRLKTYCGKCCRGLLCFGCNKYLVGVLERQAKGNKMTAIQLCKRIIAYLEKWGPILKEKGAYAAKPEAKAKKLRKKQKSLR
jgi:hypothetical protein